MTRRKNDAYYTPSKIADVITPMLGIDLGHTVREPSAGAGAWADAAAKLGATVSVCDIDPDASALARYPVDHVGDYTQAELTPVDWIVGNPPYSQAIGHVAKAVKEARVGVAFLLRLGFLGSRKRHAWLRDNPPTRLIVLSKRPSFTSDGRTDSYDYAVMVWGGPFAGVSFVDGAW